MPERWVRFCAAAHIGGVRRVGNSTICNLLKVLRHPLVGRNVAHLTKVVLLVLLLAGCRGAAAAEDGDNENDEDDAAADDGKAVPVILRGHETSSDPAVVKVQRHHGRSGLGVCTGTLIAPRYVLTARHCTGNGRLEVLVGDGARPARIAVTRTHHDRPTGSSRNSGDIAVLELASAATVAPLLVNLDAAKVMGLQEARVIGFGLTGARIEDERKRTVEFASRTTSEYVESQRRGVVCYGDSGGPTLGIIDGHEQVIAVTSHMTSTRCANGRVRSVRTDRHRAFLTAFVDSSAAPSPAPPAPPPTTPAPTTTAPPVIPIPPPVVPSAPLPQARVEPRPPPVVVPHLPPIQQPVPVPSLPPLPPRVTASNGSTHAHASSSSTNGRTRASAHVDGTGAHAEAHAE